MRGPFLLRLPGMGLRLVWEKEYPIWEKYYPRNSPVVDIGADPESIKFFENRGQKVIPIGDEVGSHIGQGAIKIDIDGGEWGLVIETHEYKPKLKFLYDMGGGTRIYRLEKGRRLHNSLFWHIHHLGIRVKVWFLKD